MFIFFGVAGLIIISVAIWIKNEKQQDALFMLGGLCLLVYSISIKDIIFSTLQLIFIASSLIELLKIKKSKK